MWRIFYANARQYSTSDGPWADAPVYGVVVVSEQTTEHNKRLVHNFQFYWLDQDGRIQGADWKDLPSPRPKNVKIGESIKESMYRYWLKKAEEIPV